MTLLSLVAVVFFAALVVGLPDLGGAPERVVFVGAVAASSMSWKGLLAWLGTLLGRRASAQRLRRPTTILGSAIILFFGVVIMLDALRPML